MTTKPTLKERGDASKAKLAKAKANLDAKAAGIKQKAKEAIAEDVAAPAKKPTATQRKKAASAELGSLAGLAKIADKMVEAIEKKVPPRKTTAKKSAEPFDVAAAAEVEVAAGVVANSEDGVKRAIAMAEVMLKAEREVNDLEEKLKTAKEKFKKIEQGDLPDLMRELGLEMFKLPDGSVFDLVEDVQCGISEERRPAAHLWIREHGFAGLIKTQIVAEFAPDEIERADQIEKELIEEGVTPERKESIHAARLKSFVKERLAAGDSIPFDTFGIIPFDRVKVKQPKTPRKAS